MSVLVPRRPAGLVQLMCRRERALRGRVRVWLALFALCGALQGCGSERAGTPSAGGNSNWLRLCTTPSECSETSACECGACTLTCTTDVDCESLFDARCVASDAVALASVCNDAAPGESRGICLPRCEPGGCDSEQACIDGACVPLPLPDNAFCAQTGQRSQSDRATEDALLAALSALRAQGGVDCGDGAGRTSAALPLRADAALWCAARARASDARQLGDVRPSQFDSSGRDLPTRLRAASYAPALWGEAFAVDASDPQDALRLMLSDPATCARLLSASFRDVGVGSDGRVQVIVVASDSAGQ